MPFMEAGAEYFSMFHIETSIGTEMVPAELVGDNPDAEKLQAYLEGEPGAPLEMEKRTGWYANFSAPGYLDRTDYIGPFASAEKALDALAEQYDCCRECWENECDCDESDDDEE